jgi:ParB-like chromosome segregation protein Spo0J
MSFAVKLVAPAEREAIIAKAVQSSSKTVPFHDFRSRTYELPVVRVSTDLPVYRMENFRTYTDQHEYIAKERLPADYFTTGQEIESVQQVQHEILDRLARKGVSDSVVPVIKVLEKEGQREPLLITATGVMVNGNRRLAALRELGVRHLDVMVLPADASADEIVDIEASLQGRPETKLDYDWIGDGQLINRLIGMGRTTKQVADQLHRSKKDIENARAALIEADLYLKEWAKAEGEYGRISEDAEQLFKDLPKRLENKEATLAHASRVIAWTLYDNRAKVAGRIYNYNQAFGNLAADVLERVATDLGVSTTAPPVGAPSKDDDIDFDLEDDEEVPSYEAVIEALSDGATSDDAVDVLIEASITAIEVAKGQKDGEAALKALAEANAKMVSVDLTRASSKTYPAIKKQLDTIEGLLVRLRAKLDEIS